MPQALMGQASASFDGKKIFPTPLPLAEFLVVEVVSRKLENYTELAYSTAHPDATLFPGWKLSFQREISAESVERYYAHDRARADQDSYNAEIHYGAEAVAYPTAVRNYLIPRASYAAEAKLTPDPLINGPSGPVLVKEDMVQVPDERLTGLYVAVQKVYKTLPSPWIPFTRYDENLGPIQGKRRQVVNTNQSATLTATGKTTYEAENESSIVAWEIVETWSDGTGSGGNPAYPILVDDFFDDERSAVHRTKQLVTDLSSVGSLVVSAGTATDTRYESYNQFLRRKIIETWSVPSTARSYNLYGRRGFAATLSRNRVTAGSTPTTQTELIEVERAVEGKDRVREDVLTYQAGGSPLLRKKFSRFGGLDVVTDKFVAPSTTPTNTTYTVQELIQETEKRARLIETVMATGTAITTIEQVDPRIPGSRATIAYSLVLASDSHPADTSTEVYERLEMPDNALMRIQRKTTYAIPASFFEIRDMSFAFPTLFYDYYSDNIQGTTIHGRSGFSAMTPHDIEHTFGTSLGTVSPIQIIENDILAFSVQVRGIMDADTITKIVNGTSYTQDIDASDPSLTDYLSIAGSGPSIVGGDCEIWRAGIFHTRTFYITLV